EVVRTHRLGLGFFAASRGGADNLPHLHAAAGEELIAEQGPVIAPTADAVDVRGSAEFTHDRQQNLLFQSAGIEVVEKHGEGPVELGDVFVHLLFNRAVADRRIGAVRIPTAVPDVDQADA